MVKQVKWVAGGGGRGVSTKHQAPSAREIPNPKLQLPKKFQLPTPKPDGGCLGLGAALRQRIAEMGDRQYEREERFHRARRWRHGDQGTGVWAGGGKTGRGNGDDGRGWHE